MNTTANRAGSPAARIGERLAAQPAVEVQVLRDHFREHGRIDQREALHLIAGLESYAGLQ